MTPSTALEPSSPQCGAQLRGKPGTFCRQPSGHRTNHPGEGRCWLHGGLTPVRHGRYSSVVRREIQELIRELEADPDPLNILPELLMVRALLADYLNRYEENRDAVLAWYASWNGRPWKVEDLTLIREVLAEYEGRMRQDGSWEEESMERAQLERAQRMMSDMSEAYQTRPREVLDIADAYRMASEATKIVERIEKIRARGAVSREDFARVMTEMGRTIEAALSPAKVRMALGNAGVEPLPKEEVMVALADDLRNSLIDLLMTIRVV